MSGFYAHCLSPVLCILTRMLVYFMYILCCVLFSLTCDTEDGRPKAENSVNVCKVAASETVVVGVVG